MDCEQTLALISARIDREIAPDDRALLESHLKECDACRITAEAFQLQDEELRHRFAERRQAAAAVAEEVIAQLPLVVGQVSNPPSRRRGGGAKRRYVRPGLLAGLLSAAAVIGVAVLLHWLKPTPLTQPLSTSAGDHVSSFQVADKLTARPRGAAPKTQPLAVGETLKTEAGQRRRVALPDGSVLYVNQNSTLRLNSSRQVRLDAGEVFVEVAPQHAEQGTFVIQTPTRAVTALGTKFAVRAEPEGTGVVVTQGKVKVSGLDALVHAGQQLAPKSETPLPAPRAAYVLDWARELIAEAGSPLVPGSAHCGGALIAVDPWGQEAKLSLRKFHIDVHIEDGFARTTIDQTYFNHNAWRMEGTFYFPLPPDASLSRLAMYVDGVLMEGGMAERNHARQVFETIMYTQRDPALLEWVDGSTFKMRVFPLEGRQEKRIVLSYTQKLESLYGRTFYRFPAGHSLQLVNDWSFHALVKGGAELKWQSGSHTLEAKKTGDDLALDARLKFTKPDKDVTLELDDGGREAAKAVRFSTAEHEGAKYLMVRHRPRLEGAARKQRRDWVFLFEAAGDRDPLLARAQIEIIRTMLTHAEHEDTFSILAANTRVLNVHGGLTPTARQATSENIESALGELERVHLIGALDLGQALTAAVERCSNLKNPCLVHVGSGIAALGERTEDLLAKKVPDHVPYVGVGVGKRWGRSFMKLAAERSGGAFTQINPDEPVAWRAFQLLDLLNAPRLHHVRVVDNEEKVSFLSYASTIAQGEEICAIARIEKGKDLPKSVTVSGTRNGKPVSEVFEVKNVSKKADYLPRTWAKLEIDRLLTENADKHQQRITELSMAMYVMTPFTSLLVLENEAMYAQFKVDRGRKDHWALYPCPQKVPVVYEPDPTQGIDVRNAPKNAEPRVQKPATEQLMQTILVRVPPRFFIDNQAPYYGGQVFTVFQFLTSEGAREKTLQELESRLRRLQLLRERTLGGAASEELLGLERQMTALREKSADAPVMSLLALPQMDQWSGGFSLGGGLGSRSEQLTALRSTLSPTPINPWANGLTLPPMTTITATSTSPVAETATGGRANFEWWEGGLSVPGKRPHLSAGDLGGFGYLPGWRRGTGWTTIPGLDASGGLPQGAVPYNFNLFLEVLDEKEGGKYKKGQRSMDLAETLFARLATGYGQLVPTYQRPTFSGDDRIYFDLVGYAPGMATSRTDILAVLEAEGRADPRSAPGYIEPAAVKLIDRARSMGWESVRIAESHGALTPPRSPIFFDGAGRYRFDRVLPDGLKETVVCDGQTILHLYPELGLGARRPLSCFHRAELAGLVPWSLPPGEDLARGADVKSVGARAVQVTPKSATGAKDADGKPVRHAALRLLFAADGRLAERQLVELPADKVLARETYDADGTVRRLDAAGREISVVRLNRRKAEAPDLEPDTSTLVVLPFPLRTRQHVYQARAINQSYEKLSEEAALELIAADFASNPWEAAQVFEHRFHQKGDRRIGFYTLLAAGGLSVDSRQRNCLDVLVQHPRHDLAKYLAHVSDPNRRQNRGNLSLSEGTLLERLATFRDLYQDWQSGRATQGSVEQRRTERDRTLNYIRKNQRSAFAWALLGAMWDRIGSEPESQRLLAEAARSFEQYPGLAYAVRYEIARSLVNAGKTDEARRQFVELYHDTLKEGALPAIDSSFRQALVSSDGHAWTDFMRQTAQELLKPQKKSAEKKPPKRVFEVIILAWQCHQLGDPMLADELLGLALSSADETERAPATLAAIEFLWSTNQLAHADALLQPLLKDDKLNQSAGLWRLAAIVAQRQNMLSRAVEYLDRAMELKYRELPPVVNIQAVRQEYGGLLSAYEQLVQAHRMLETKPPSNLVGRVVRTADRWRAIDPDPTACCQLTSRILKLAGAYDLAWDYLTTPIALRPNDGTTFLGLAQSLRNQGDFELADKAYVLAFESESTNAQILWDRAQNLQQSGKPAEARQVYRQLADGQWQPRFQWIQQQARGQLGRR